jgi:predicted permease
MERHVPSSEPIEPGGSAGTLPVHAEALLNNVSRLHVVVRFALAVLCGLLSWACFSGAARFFEYKHWISWVVILLLLEPMGIAMALGAVFFIAPQSRLSRWFMAALSRAGATAALFLLALGCGVATIIVAGLWELYRLSR